MAKIGKFHNGRAILTIERADGSSNWWCVRSLAEANDIVERRGAVWR